MCSVAWMMQQWEASVLFVDGVELVRQHDLYSGSQQLVGCKSGLRWHCFVNLLILPVGIPRVAGRCTDELVKALLRLGCSMLCKRDQVRLYKIICKTQCWDAI